MTTLVSKLMLYLILLTHFQLDLLSLALLFYITNFNKVYSHAHSVNDFFLLTQPLFLMFLLNSPREIEKDLTSPLIFICLILHSILIPFSYLLFVI